MKSDQHQKKALIARIHAAGVPVRPYSETRTEQLVIRQDSGAYESTIFDVSGGTGLIIPLHLTSNSTQFQFSDVVITLSLWPSPLFRPLEENIHEEWPAYEFHGLSHFKFARSEVINGVIAERKVIRRGDSVRGLFLALTRLPMPDNLGRGDILSGAVEVYDESENRYSQRIFLRVNRVPESIYGACRQKFGGRAVF